MTNTCRTTIEINGEPNAVVGTVKRFDTVVDGEYPPLNGRIYTDYIISTLRGIGWIMILYIVAIMLIGCEKNNDCKTYQCGGEEVNAINYGSYYKDDECECIERFNNQFLD